VFSEQKRRMNLTSFLKIILILFFIYTDDPGQCVTQVRFKGHNKWSNIKHIKLANDARISKLCSKYTYCIGVAIRENGMEKNPAYNCKTFFD